MTEPHAQSAPLDGEWLICTDPDNKGRDEQWYTEIKKDAVTAKSYKIIQHMPSTCTGCTYYETCKGVACVGETRHQFL